MNKEEFRMRLATTWTVSFQVPAGAGKGSFIFATATRPALGPTQPLIQWVSGSLSLG